MTDISVIEQENPVGVSQDGLSLIPDFGLSNILGSITLDKYCGLLCSKETSINDSSNCEHVPILTMVTDTIHIDSGSHLFVMNDDYKVVGDNLELSVHYSSLSFLDLPLSEPKVTNLVGSAKRQLLTDKRSK